MRYRHVYEIAFSVDSDYRDGSDVTPAMLRSALLRRVADLEAKTDSYWWVNACNLFDTSNAPKPTCCAFHASGGDKDLSCGGDTATVTTEDNR